MKQLITQTKSINEVDKSIEEKLWSDFESVRDLPNISNDYIKARNGLIEYYYNVVEKISEKLVRRLKELTADDIASYGVDGLIDAIESFDSSRDVSFKTWATIRIRGSVIDNIRKADWVPRLVRQRNSRLEEVRNKIKSIHGECCDHEIAKELGISLEEYSDLVQKSTPIAQFSMNAKPRGDYDNDYDEIGDISMSAESVSPDNEMLRKEMYNKLLGRSFTSPERKIITLHYYENMTMKEIADRTGFSESRISQMHADIIRRLQKKMERNPKYASELNKLLEKK